MRVICYRNLNRGDWSVAAINGRSGVGKVIAHMPELTLANVTFVVRESPTDLPSIAVTYNPYRAPTFVRRVTGQPITRSDFVRFTLTDGAIAVGTTD